MIGQNVYFGGKLLVSNGVTVVTDRLGPVRANGQGEKFSYYPYGEERTATVDGREKFGTYFRDLGTGLDYAEQRYYGNGAGRFWSVDPGGIKTADPTNPLDWNRYAYVQGDPVKFADQSGRYKVYVGSGQCVVGVGEGAELTSCDYYSTSAFAPEEADGDQGGGGVKYRPPGYNGARLDLGKPDCYKMFGYKAAVDAQNAFASLTFVPQNLGVLQIQDGPGGQSIVQGTQPPAEGAGNTVTINLTYNWYDFSKNPAFDVTTKTPTTSDYLAAENQDLGTNMTTPQLSALILLHEFEHSPLGGQCAAGEREQPRAI